MKPKRLYDKVSIKRVRDETEKRSWPVRHFLRVSLNRPEMNCMRGPDHSGGAFTWPEWGAGVRTSVRCYPAQPLPPAGRTDAPSPVQTWRSRSPRWNARRLCRGSLWKAELSCRPSPRKPETNDIAKISAQCHLEIRLVLLRSESPSGKCAKLHTVTASNNTDHAPRSVSTYAIYGHYSSRTCRSWWIAYSAQRQRRGCTSFLRTLRPKMPYCITTCKNFRKKKIKTVTSVLRWCP